jgi:hypothetical protein
MNHFCATWILLVSIALAFAAEDGAGAGSLKILGQS